MVTSPYEGKILEWDEKPRTNKVTYLHKKVMMLIWLPSNSNPFSVERFGSYTNFITG